MTPHGLKLSFQHPRATLLVALVVGAMKEIRLVKHRQPCACSAQVGELQPGDSMFYCDTRNDDR